ASQDQRLIGEVAGAAVPAVVGLVVAGERRMKAGDASGPPLVEPGIQRVALANPDAAKIEHLECAATPGPQAADAREPLGAMVERRSDEGADADVELCRFFPVVEAMRELFETRKRELAALARFRDQAIPADMRARRVPQRQRQSSGQDLSRHRQARYIRCN